MFWRMNDAPIAVISGASRGALRSGLYAMSSTVTLSSPQKAMQMRSATITSGQSTYHAWPWWRSKREVPTTVTAIIEPSMKTSPCAKLISSRMP